MRAEKESRARDVGLSTAVSGGDGDNGHAHKRRNEENGGRTERTSCARCEQPLSAANHPGLSVSFSFTPFLRRERNRYLRPLRSPDGATLHTQMRPRKLTFATVRKLGLALPDVEEGTTYGTPALKVGGKMFACIASHKSAEPGTLVVRIPFNQRDEMIATEPGIYYLEDHYVGYPCVLVRLARIGEDALRDLLLTGWRFVSASNKQRGAKRAAGRIGFPKPPRTRS
jgi:hypothetical protein